MKGIDEDEGKQSNKKHKALRNKIKKKRIAKKERKKDKKDKSKKKNKEKHRKHKESKEKHDSDGSASDAESKIDKYIKKLREIMEEEADDLFEMFELLDNNGEVDISGLENEKVRTYLQKLFKYLGLKKNPETKEYTKGDQSDIKKRFENLWYKDLSDSSDSESEKQEEKGSKRSDSMEEEKKAETGLKDSTKSALFQGIDDKKIKSTEDDKLTSFLDSQFKTFESDKKLSGGMTKSREGQDQSKGSERDNMIDEFMKEYNAQFRKKSLLEEHQDRKKGIVSTEKQERRAFDRTVELGQKVDSKKIFKMLNSKEFNLNSRFENAKTGNKYL